MTNFEGRLFCVYHTGGGRSWDFSDGILEQSMEASDPVEIGLSYLSARLHRLAEWVPWNRFLGSLTI